MSESDPVPVLGADHDGVRAAVDALSAGGCIAVPTDTVYGVAAALRDPQAIRRLFDIKGRAATKAMAVLVGSAAQAREIGIFSELATSIVGRYWPGSLTVVVKRAPSLRIDLGGDSATIGIRCPDSSLVAAITAQVGPIVTTSANLAGESTLQDPQSIAATFGARLDVVLDGGVLSGPASTVIDLTGPGIDILREGPITARELLSGH